MYDSSAVNFETYNLASSDASPLIDDVAYLALIEKNFPNLPRKEVEFFVNPKRFILFQNLLGKKLGSDVQTVLNVACGPFAFENYVNNSRNTQIDAFDIDGNVAGMYQDLKRTGLFNHVDYKTSSAIDYDTSKQFDLVLINDLFYHKAVDFHQTFERLASRVAPKGYLYFDVLDVRARKIWSLLGKDARFVRYDLEKIKYEVEQSGFEILSITPSLGIGSNMDYLLRKTLLTTCNIANNYIFLARRKS